MQKIVVLEGIEYTLSWGAQIHIGDKAYSPLSDAIVTIDKEDDLLYVNSSYLKVMNYKKKIRRTGDLEDFLEKIKKVDPELLQEQKDIMTAYITDKERLGLTDALKGVLNLLDVITDYIDPKMEE